jgi:fatty acid desaturase
VPFHALPALNAAIRDQLPEPSPSLWAAHAEIVRVILAQRSDPKAIASRSLPQPLVAEPAQNAAAV